MLEHSVDTQGLGYPRTGTFRWDMFGHKRMSMDIWDMGHQWWYYDVGHVGILQSGYIGYPGMMGSICNLAILDTCDMFFLPLMFILDKKNP